MHPKVMLSSRFVKFHKSCIDSSKLSIRLLANLSQSDNRTVMGRNMTSLLTECDMKGSSPDKLTPTIVKSKCRYSTVPSEEAWKLNVVNELLDTQLLIPGFSSEEISTMMNTICIE